MLALADRITSGERDRLFNVFHLLRAVEQRVRFRRTLKRSSIALLGSSCAVAIVRVLTVVNPPSPEVQTLFPLLYAIVLVVPPFAAAAAAAFNCVDLTLIARFVDQELGLKERLSTAVMMDSHNTDGAFASFVARDAEKKAGSLDAGNIVRIKWGLLQTSAATAAALAFCLLFVRVPSSLKLTEFQRMQSTSLEEGGSPVHPNPQMSGLPSAALHSAKGVRSNVELRQREQAVQSAGAPLEKTVGSIGKSSTGKTISGQRNSLKVALSKSQGPPSGRPAPYGTNGSANQSAVTLGDKLRKFADRVAIRKMTSGELQQAADSLAQVIQKLNGLSMPKTQQQLSVSEQDLRDFQQQAAVKDIRKAASLADTEGATPQPGGGSNGADSDKNSVVVPTKSAASGQGEGGAAHSIGTNSAQNDSNPGGAPSTPGTQAPGGGNQKPTFGALRQIDPAKLGRSQPMPPIALPVSNLGGRFSETEGRKETVGQTAGASAIAYVKAYTQYRRKAESEIRREEIPPSYKETVEKYFLSLADRQ